jgi:energy-coupling factor transport system substrate-specific component
MSWQVAAFTILALALGAGFAWYERTRPDARIVALVATLAAFAALGRIAFAALPNVKPTTDIVLLSGYALGGAPGFAVGALAGLSSNFFFGQGPWTPWQMAAWGATGLIGAGLARLTGRRVNRWFLAAVCGVVGFGFTAVQDVGDWVTYGDHSLRQLGVYVGKGIGFDAVHATGCAAFALAFGPALARSIARFALRLQVRWLPPSGAIVPAVVALVLSPIAWLASQSGSRAQAATTPSSYLLSAQNPDGGFGPSPGGASSGLYAGWAALGLASAGYNAQTVRHGGPSLADYLVANETTAHDPGSVERTMLALRASGLSAGPLAGELQGDIRGDGSISDQVNLTSFAILALRAAGDSPPAATTSWLGRQQDADGGFNFAVKGGSSDIDDTGAALEALAGRGGAAIDRAAHYIYAHENSDGGFGTQPGAASNAQSTAWAVQGLLATGASYASLGRPLAYLRSLIAPDGHVRYASGSDQTPVWVTAEALMALDGKPLPLAPVAASREVAAPSAPRVRSAIRHSPARAVRSHRSPHHRPRSSLARLVSAFGLAEAIALAPVE